MPPKARTKKKAPECSISRGDFEEKVKKPGRGVRVEVDGVPGTIRALPRDFATGSFGWFLTGKATVMLDGEPVKCQLSGYLTVIGSKETR